MIKVILVCVLIISSFSPIAQTVSHKSAEKYVGKMLDIPGGIFTMGSHTGAEDEKPLHKVTVEPFKMGQTEVTWSQYQPCIDEGFCPDNSASGGDYGWGKGNRPVIAVSYYDITRHFLPWLNNKTGNTYRLPTEAEWEYAARAGSTTQYSWGDTIGNNNANCDGCNNQASINKTLSVASFKANAFGLYDMHGNVWEWTSDCRNSSYKGAPIDGTVWSSGDCDIRSLRGGSWSSKPVQLRSSERGWATNNTRYDCSGFRLVQSR